MPNRTFRTEFLRDVLDENEVARINTRFDLEMPAEFCDIVFRAKDDGKHYAFEYHFNNDVGVDSFEGRHDSYPVECYEVEKAEVKTVTWERV